MIDLIQELTSIQAEAPDAGSSSRSGIPLARFTWTTSPMLIGWRPMPGRFDTGLPSYTESVRIVMGRWWSSGGTTQRPESKVGPEGWRT